MERASFSWKEEDNDTNLETVRNTDGDSSNLVQIEKFTPFSLKDINMFVEKVKIIKLFC